MAEVGEVTRGVSREEFWEHLDKTDSANLKHLSSAIRRHADDLGIDVHLVAVGGMVDPTRRSQSHKDIDLVLYSPDLAIDNSPSSGVKNFDKFLGFLDGSVGFLKWPQEVIEPFWEDFDRSSDGSVTFRPHSGKPVEVLPTRVDALRGSFDEFLATQTRTFSVLF